MSKRAHRKRVKGKKCPSRRWLTKTKQYVNNTRRKYEYEKGEVLWAKQF